MTGYMYSEAYKLRFLQCVFFLLQMDAVAVGVVILMTLMGTGAAANCSDSEGIVRVQSSKCTIYM